MLYVLYLGSMLMRKLHRRRRALFFSLLLFTVLAPLVLVSNRLKYFTLVGRKGFVEDLPSLNYRTKSEKLRALEQVAGEDFKGPERHVYDDSGSLVTFNSTNWSDEPKHNGNTLKISHGLGQSGSAEYMNNPLQINGTSFALKEIKKDVSKSDEQRPPRKTIVLRTRNTTQKSGDDKVKEMKDQLVRAKVYLSLASPASHSHFMRELRLRIKELERVVNVAKKNSDLSRSALQKMKSMDDTLAKARRVFPHCSPMVKNLQSLTRNSEDLVRAQRIQKSFLVNLAARTTPKGLHCLSLLLTAEYFALPPENRKFPNQRRLNDPNLHHYAVFSDNILASAVVVNSTVSNAKDPKKVVFHVITDSLKLPAISMWFLLNPPSKATIEVQSTENFEWLSKYNSTVKPQNSNDPRFLSALNHLRFYLPDIFPQLNKILFLDHDVVVQRDLSELWSLNMKGKVNAAVETCQENDSSFHRMDMLINFSDPYVTKRFDVRACTWAFGMNLFDLKQWRRRNLTARYLNYLEEGYKRPLWKAGSLPLGWATFYNQTIGLDPRWHRPGLGHESTIRQGEIDQAAVLHYDGVMKPWLDIGVVSYKKYWSKYINYDYQYLQQCNIQQ